VVGEFSEESTKETKVVLKESSEPLHKKEHLLREGKNETLLEFLESCDCWMVNPISKTITPHYWSSHRVSFSSHI
jgi:hypothetical protein